MIRKNLSSHVLRVFSVCMVAILAIGSPLTAIAANGSITANSVTITLVTDADTNSYANIGDTIRITADISNADNVTNTDCTTATPSTTVNLVAYGGSATQNVPLLTCNNGTNDIWQLDFVIVDAAGNGIDVNSGDNASKVTITTADSDEAPVVTLQSASGLTAANGIDTIAPSVLSRVMLDTNTSDGSAGTTNGQLDGVLITFDDIMDASSAISTDFVMTTSANGALTEAYSDTTDNTTLFFRVTDSATGNTSDLIKSQITGTITDDAGNAVTVDGAGVSSTDGASPVITDLEYYSSGNNGTVDRIDVDFSENVTWNYNTLNQFAITNNNLTSFDNDTQPDGASGTGTSTITLTTSGTTNLTGVGTGTQPTTDYAQAPTASNRIKDSSGNDTVAMSATSIADGADPVIDTFEYQDANSDGMIDQIEVFYTENVVASSFLSANDLTFTNVGDFTGSAFGTLATDLITGTVGSTIVPFGTTSTTVDTHEDSGTIAISTQNAFSLQDSAGNTNNTLGAQTNATFEDLAAPIATGAAYSDSNNDGTIDGAGINFSENVSYTYQAGDWSATPNGLTNFALTGCSACTNTNLLQFTATADNNLTGVNSGSEPSLAYTAGNSITDTASNNALNFSGAMIDMAAPVMIESHYYDNDHDGQVNTADAKFTEYIQLTSYADSDWTIGAGSIGLANETSTSVHGGNGNSEYLDIVAFGNANSTGGTTAPTISYTNNSGRVSDGKGNNAVSSGPLNMGDLANPLVASVTSGTPNGKYGPSSSIGVSLHFTENVSGTPTVHLDTGGTASTNITNSILHNTAYNVGVTGSGENSSDLTVSSITGTITDGSSNSTTNPTVPAGQNIADSSDIVVDTVAPTVTDGNISISGATGTAGAYKVGDTVVVTWDSASDGNSDVASATANLSGWGGAVAVVMEDNGAGGACNDGGAGDDVWCAAYTILGTEGIDNTNVNTSVTATDNATNPNSSSAVADSSNATVDTIMPTVTPANLTVTGATGTGGTFKFADTPTLDWNTAADGEGDVIASVTFNGTNFAAADNALVGVHGATRWTASLSAGMDSQDDTGNTVTATVVDNAGNSTGPVTSSTGYSIDTISPTFSDNGTLTITVDNGVAGVAAVNGGANPSDRVTQAGATILAPDGDTITIDLSGLTGQAALANGSQSTAVVAGTLDNTSQTFTLSAIDNAGNETVTASDAISVDNVIPSLVLSGLNLSTDNGIHGTAAVNGGGVAPDQVLVNAAVGTPDGDTITWNATPIGGGTAIANNTAATVVAGATDVLQAFSITATDNAGNTVTSDSNAIDGTRVRVDNILPVFLASGLTILTDNGVVGVAAVNGGGIAPDMVKVNATVTVPDGDTITWDATPIGSGATVTNNVGASVGAGAIDTAIQAFNITVTDNGGNTVIRDSNTIDTKNIALDNIMPTIGTVGSLAITTDNNTNSEANVNDTVTYNDGVPGTADGDAWTVDLTGLTGDAAATNAGSPYTVIIGALNGAVTFTESVTDNAGNVATGQTSTLAVDNRSPLTNTSVTLSNTQTGASTNFTVAFDTTAIWPADGKFELIFPAEFNVAGLDTHTATALTNVDGVITAGVTGQTVVLTRDGSGTPVAGGTSVSFNIATGTNGGTAGVTGQFSFKTLTNGDVLIDIDDNVTGVTLTTPPAAGGGGGGGGRSTPPATTHDTKTDTEKDAADTEETADASAVVFTDIAGHWAEAYIKQAKEAGYIQGYEDETFKPNRYITRSEASKLIAMWLNKDITDDSCTAGLFSDVDCSTWYAKYVTYLENKGIIKGYKNGTFKPGDNINRAEALKMMLFAKAIQDTDIADLVNPFSDVSMDDWFYNYVMIGYKLSIIQGYKDGTFGPANNITRAEFTKIFIETLINN